MTEKKEIKQISIVALEEQFQQLRYLLTTVTSNRLKLNYMNQFLCLLASQKNPANYQSYLLELLPFFMDNISPQTLEYRSVECIKALQKNCRLFNKANVNEVKSPEFIRIHNRLSCHLARTYFYLGAWKEGLHILFPEIKDNSVREFFHQLGPLNSTGSGLESFREIVAALQRFDREKLDDEGLKTLNNIEQDWQKIINGYSSHNVWVLLIEQNSAAINLTPGKVSSPFDEMNVATIQPLSIKADIRPSDVDEDHILFNNRPLSLNDLIFHQSQDAAAAAKKMLFTSRQKKYCYYKIMYSFSDKHSFYTGDSQGLAMGLLNAAALAALNLEKYTYKIGQGFAVTGVLDLSGNVRPIAEQSLKPKLEALFYSPFKQVLLPQKNQEQAANFLKDLSAAYPNRNLTIETVEKLAECFNKPAIILTEKAPFSDRLLSKNRWKKYGFAAVILFLSLFGLKAINWDRNPVSLKIDGKYIRVYNQKNIELWNYDFGIELEQEYYNSIVAVKNPRFIVGDLNSDGINEVLFGTIHNTDKKFSGAIYYFNADGKLKWRFQDHPLITFGEEIMDNFFKPNAILTNDFNQDGIMEIIVNFFHYRWYPSKIVRLDLEGKIQGTYWNSGYIYELDFIDLDGNGVEEIVFTGTNNDYNRGIMGVLEYDNISGHSPPGQFAYTPQGVKAGSEKYYMRFPTMNHLVTPIKGKRDAAQRCVNLAPDKLAVWVEQAGFNNADIQYILDYNLNIMKMGFADGAFSYYREKYGSDLYADFSKEQIDDHFKTIEFWDGDKWILKPTKNRKNYPDQVLNSNRN